MATRRRKKIAEVSTGLATYTGRGGEVTFRGQTVSVRADARRGYYMIDVVRPDGRVTSIPVKGTNLSPRSEEHTS